MSIAASTLGNQQAGPYPSVALSAHSTLEVVVIESSHLRRSHPAERRHRRGRAAGRRRRPLPEIAAPPSPLRFVTRSAFPGVARSTPPSSRLWGPDAVAR